MATLAIVEQPSSQIVFKGKIIEHPFVVQLVTGAKVHMTKTSPVKASIADEESWKNPKPLTNDRVTLNSQLRGSFDDIRLNISTRMTSIHLKFSCTLKHKESREELLVKSTLSNPIIVITNESQWAEAAGRLFSLEAFAGQSDASWPHFANVLQTHVFRATNQDASNAPRSFADWELTTLRQRFFS